MKTKNIFKTVALAMLMPAMLLTTACSSEDDALNNTANTETVANKGYALPVTVNVTRGDGVTRASFDGSKLNFSAGDKLFVEGIHTETARFAGTLDYDTEKGNFSGTIYTQNEWLGTADALLTDASASGKVNATLLPNGYKSYNFLSIYNYGSDDLYDDVVAYSMQKAFVASGTAKKTGVEQLSWEKASTYSSGFALAPANAVLNFTITGFAASTQVAVVFTSNDGTVNEYVTTDGSGNATFALGVSGGEDLHNCTLSVAGNAITLVNSSKTLTAGHIYNISRSVAPAAKNLAEATAEDIGKVVGADGKIYANVAAAQAASTTACAIIAYVGSETGESQNHGLAIAMKDAAAGCYIMWSSSNNDESQLTNYTVVNQAVSTFQSGLSNSQYYEFDNETDYPAFYAALHNTISTSDGISADAPDPGTSGWFLPSLYQWNKIVQGLSGQSANLSDDTNDNYTASSLNAKITAAGGDGLQDDAYWSSTEYDGDYAWLFYAGGGLVTNKSEKYGEYCVRSVFAF